MPHPLAEFDLEANADERAVKRAYAKRLKVTRPDEDAAAFQALNEAYQMALAYIRWRDAQDEDEDEDEGGEPEEGAEAQEAEAQTPADAPMPESGPVVAPPPDPAQSPEVITVDPADITLLETPQEYIFSVVEFVAQMRSGGHYANPDRFRAWIRERMRDWPITAKPAFAHAIIVHVLENSLHLHPDIYDVLIEELGLNDVSNRFIDPLEIAHYRDELARRYESEIFTPAPPAVQRGKWYQSRWSEIGSIAFLCLCGLLLVVVAFLQGAPEAPQNEWYQSQPGTTASPISINMVPGMDKEAIGLLNSAADMSGTQAVETLDKIIARLSDRTELGNERLLALALYNKGHALQHDDRDRGYAAYGELQKRFQPRRDHDLALFVAASHVNMGLEDYLHDRLDTAMSSYGAVVSRYGFIAEGQIGMQVYKAMFGQAEVYNAQKNYDQALQILTVIGAKFGNSSDSVLRTTATDQAADLRAKVNRNRPAP